MGFRIYDNLYFIYFIGTAEGKCISVVSSIVLCMTQFQGVEFPVTCDMWA